MMGLSVEQTLAMSLHDYQAAVFHFNKANSPDEEDSAPLSDGDFDEMMVVAAGLKNGVN